MGLAARVTVRVSAGVLTWPRTFPNLPRLPPDLSPQQTAR
jgi:hypothetical protein